MALTEDQKRAAKRAAKTSGTATVKTTAQAALPAVAPATNGNGKSNHSEAPAQPATEETIDEPPTAHEQPVIEPEPEVVADTTPEPATETVQNNTPQDNDLEEQFLVLDERVDGMDTRLTATEKVVTEHSTKFKTLQAQFEKSTPAEDRLGRIFDLKLATTADKVAKALTESVTQALNQSKSASEKATQALAAADQAAKSAERMAKSTESDIDRVLEAATEAVESKALMQEALVEMQRIGEFVANTKDEMDSKIETTLTKLREEFMGQLAELRNLIVVANQPTPPPPAPKPVMEEEKPIRPWMRGK